MVCSFIPFSSYSSSSLFPTLYNMFLLAVRVILIIFLPSLSLCEANLTMYHRSGDTDVYVRIFSASNLVEVCIHLSSSVSSFFLYIFHSIPLNSFSLSIFLKIILIVIQACTKSLLSWTLHHGDNLQINVDSCILLHPTTWQEYWYVNYTFSISISIFVIIIFICMY